MKRKSLYIKNKNVIVKFLLFGILMAYLNSCSTIPKTKSGAQQTSIVNTKWILAENVKGKIPTLTIESNKIYGNAGCNNYFGNVSLDSTIGNFKASQLGSTKMACENMSIEDNFLKMMEEANKYAVKGNSLELYRDNLLLLKFNKQ